MRNDSIERSVNDSMLTIADYILQMIEQTKRQQELDIKRLAVGDDLSLLNEEREEAEYELYYALIKERQPDLFKVKGDLVESFSVEKDKSFLQIFHKNGQFYGVYKHESQEAHKVTHDFQSKEEVLGSTLGTSEFEKFRGLSFFLSKDGKAFSLQYNKQFRLNLVKPYKTLSFYESIEQARSFVVKEELKTDPKLRIQSLRRTLEKYHIPSDLIGKTVTLNRISKDDEGIRISFEEAEKERNIRLPDLAEKWMERVRDNPRMRVAFDELIMDSCSIGEGFLAFYGMDINKELQTRQHDFEVISNAEGSYIGKLSGNGRVKKLSPYFFEEEAKKQLENLTKYIQLEIQNERYIDKESGPTIKFMGRSEKQ
ncbi:hypothetical protein QF028_000216 [Neobacillus sp. B4I6]|uniref:hypothetical protein n=1 Tax=Neobacillus sp. B4I6 TaxID=3373925 RepID=UPI003D1C607C